VVRTAVVKAGGELEGHHTVLELVSTLRSSGASVVLVHGGGPQLTEAARVAGVETRKVAGRRVTNQALMTLAEQVWRGQCSLAWVGALAKLGICAAGLCGADGGMILARRRPPVTVTDDDGCQQLVDYGFVGDIEAVDARVLRALLESDIVPIVTPIAADGLGGTLNVNADTIAAEVAVALQADELVLLTSAPGILRDPTDPDSVVPRTDLAGLDRLQATGALQGGMRPKVTAVRRALAGGVPNVRVSGTTVSGDGQPDRELAALSHLGIELDGPAVPVYNRAHDGQAQA